MLLEIYNGVIPRQLIRAMQPTHSDFYEIWYACITSFPDSEYTIFFRNDSSARLNRLNRTDVMTV